MVRPYLGSLSKAKAAKLVRQLVDLFLDMESAVGLEVDLCKECIEWARQEKRNYLRQGPGLYWKPKFETFSKGASSRRSSIRLAKFAPVFTRYAFMKNP